MQKFTYVRAFRAALLCGFVSLTACDAPEASYVPVAPELTSVGSGGLLFCPTVQARQGTESRCRSSVAFSP